ncbi:MAG: MFS transporter [Clostridia bacterium]|nr:MFS transporter [Clostridia bacterium]MDE7348184.1 MFS transporter [Clostridia bacterium]
MNRLKNYKHTFNSCCVAGAIQAIEINLPPLLFVCFQDEFAISLTGLTALITLTFIVQLLMDALSAKIMDKIGYRTTMIISHVLVALGATLMGVLPYLISPYTGLIIAIIVMAMGGGMLEVITSPIVEAIPDQKGGKLSLLHSFYCFGYLAIVLVTVLYFTAFDRAQWRYLMFAFAIIPIINAVFFYFVPCSTLNEQRGESIGLKGLIKNKMFFLFLILILCAGACEQAISQWVSYFAEKGLNLDKATGDLVGPFSFALLMGLGRLFYGLFGYKIHIKRILPIAGIGCLLCYIIAVASNSPLFCLIACALCGLCVSITWPGTLDAASKNIPQGGTAMFALLALGGDVGCTLGPSIVGYVSDASSLGLKGGIATASVFAAIFTIASFVLLKKDDSVKLLNEINK